MYSTTSIHAAVESISTAARMLPTHPPQPRRTAAHTAIQQYYAIHISPTHRPTQPFACFCIGFGGVGGFPRFLALQQQLSSMFDAQHRLCNVINTRLRCPTSTRKRTPQPNDRDVDRRVTVKLILDWLIVTCFCSVPKSLADSNLMLDTDQRHNDRHNPSS